MTSALKPRWRFLNDDGNKGMRDKAVLTDDGNKGMHDKVVFGKARMNAR